MGRYYWSRGFESHPLRGELGFAEAQAILRSPDVFVDRREEAELAAIHIELDPALSREEGGVDHVADLIKTHFDLGGTQINLNIMDADKVLEASSNALGSLVEPMRESATALREQARDRGVEGLMLKRRSSPYRTGRTRGDWWKWKVDPLSLDAVLVYAQRGHGRRASLYTDYTFAVWQGDTLVPFAKAYSGLNDKEIGQVDRYIQRNTLERFGPVRSVRHKLTYRCSISYRLLYENNRTYTRYYPGRGPQDCRPGTYNS